VTHRAVNGHLDHRVRVRDKPCQRLAFFAAGTASIFDEPGHRHRERIARIHQATEPRRAGAIAQSHQRQGIGRNPVLGQGVRVIEALI